jgi:hypothetical protein
LMEYVDGVRPAIRAILTLPFSKK